MRCRNLLAAAAVLLVFAIPAAAHDPYTGLKSPTTGTSCCGERDCQPATLCTRADGGGEGIIVNGTCAPIDYRLIVDSPDGGIHICIRGGQVVCIPMSLGS